MSLKERHRFHVTTTTQGDDLHRESRIAVQLGGMLIATFSREAVRRGIWTAWKRHMEDTGHTFEETKDAEHQTAG